MVREYRKSFSSCLDREMETLVFGDAGVPVLAFPTSGGRFYEFEDRGMIAALHEKIDAGRIQVFCVDSVDHESWYNRSVSPRRRIQRHMQYEDFLIREVVPMVRQRAGATLLTAIGCSFGGYHATNLALRHPDLFTTLVSMSGAFDLSNFLDGYTDQDCYYHLPTWYLPNLSDPWFLTRYRRNRIVLATGWDDQCLPQNEELDRILNERQIPHEFHVWDAENAHDWPTWQRMAVEYL
jgi:esterase/lipase superfamily enzyme